MKRRSIAFVIALCIMFSVVLMTGCKKKQETYPSKNIEMVIPYKAGGASDSTARMFASYLEKELKTTITITNMGGGGTVEGMTYAYNQPSDGYTIMSCTNSHLNKQAQKASSIVFTEAFNPVVTMCKDVAVMAVRADSQFKSIDDLLAYAKANPGKVTISGVSAGAGDEQCAKQFNNGMGCELSYIPYESTSEAKAAVLGGECDILNDKVLSIASLVESGDLRPLISVSQTKITTLEWMNGVPCFGDYKIVTPEIWRGIAVKADVPQDVQDILVAACKRVQANPEWQKWLAEQGLNILTPETEIADIKAAYQKELDSDVAWYEYLATVSGK